MAAEEIQGYRNVSLAIAYNEASAKLQILREAFRRSRSRVAQQATRRSASAADGRRGVTANDAPQLSSSGDSASLPSELLDEMRLEQEVDALADLFQLACQSLRDQRPQTGTSDRRQLKQAIEARGHNHEEKERQLRQQLQESEAEFESLKREMDAQRHAAQQRLERNEERIAELRHQRTYVQRVNDLEFGLVTKWEESRRAQVALVCGEREEELRRQIRRLRRKIDDEQRFTCEVGAFRAQEMQELQQRIAERQRKHACEEAKLDARLRDAKERILRLSETRESHQRVYAQRVQQVADFLQQKAEEQRLCALQSRRAECAARIQAWWRGVMVRRCLGPFKKKKKKKTKTKKTGKLKALAAEAAVAAEAAAKVRRRRNEAKRVA